MVTLMTRHISVYPVIIQHRILFTIVNYMKSHVTSKLITRLAHLRFPLPFIPSYSFLCLLAVFNIHAIMTDHELILTPITPVLSQTWSYSGLIFAFRDA